MGRKGVLAVEMTYTFARVEGQILEILQSLVDKKFGVKDIFGTRRIKKLYGSYHEWPRIYRGMFCLEGMRWTNVHFCLTEEVELVGMEGHSDVRDGVSTYCVPSVSKTSVIIFIGYQKLPNLAGDCVRYFEQKSPQEKFAEVELPQERWRDGELWGAHVPSDLMKDSPRSVLSPEIA